MRVLLFFLDGVGIGTTDPDTNPFFADHYPTLRELLDDRLPSTRSRFVSGKRAVCVPLNATLRVKGLPQSGTGQATLYTGINCAARIGKHFGPYLYSLLKPVVASQNIFRKVRFSNRRRSTALANAFPDRFFEYIESGRKRTVAGVFAALNSGVRLRDEADLLRGSGISTDITGARWKELFNPSVPVVSPYQAGRRLAVISAEHHLTLFEYFLTDAAGHRQDMNEARRVLREIDEMLAGLLDGTDLKKTLIIVTSDHGNVEDLTTRSHTRNPVPAFLIGAGRNPAATSIRSIAHIAPLIEKILLN